MESVLKSWTGQTVLKCIDGKKPIFHKSSSVIFPKCYFLRTTCLSSSSKIQLFNSTSSCCRKLLVVSAAKKSISWSASERNPAMFRSRLFGALILGFAIGVVSTSMWLSRLEPRLYISLAFILVYQLVPTNRSRIKWPRPR